jgi:pimeloyl-ACP methyl ester carboxylesterase
LSGGTSATNLDSGPEPVRHEISLGAGRTLSALAWGRGNPQLVFLHGRGQNAFTWTSVVRRIGLPAIGIDLPGHGHSDWREDHDYGPWPNADAVSVAVERLAPDAEAVIGMSLGGATNLRLAARYPQFVRRAVVVDTTPASADGRVELTAEQRGAVALLGGPLSYGSFEEMVRDVAAVVPGRPIDALRRGVRNNSRQLADGRWIWRYDRAHTVEGGDSPRPRTLLWQDVSAIQAPLLLVIAGNSGRVQASDVEEFRRRQPTTRVEVVTGSGHSVQSDQPAVLAGLIRDFLATTEPR